MNLGSQLVNKQSVMPSSSGASWKSAGAVDGGVPDQFPAGLRVLVVDDDPTCLMILQKMLRNCSYEVTKCNRAEVALCLLRENKNGFDIVISDVHMPDMDGFKLLEHIGLEMDLPVIMMSADDSKSVVMKGVTHGACDYLIKPVRIEALRNIWQHVVRRKKHEWKDFEPSSADDGDRHQKLAEDANYSSSANEGHNWKNSKRRKDDEDEGEEQDDSSSLKKPRVVWSVELHQQFVAAVNQLGIDKAVPKKILELMNVPGLTRENVASHLQTFLPHHALQSTHNCKHLVQKYRLYLRRLSGSQHPGSINPPFMGDSSYGSINGLDHLQALAATGQLPSQSLATLQAGLSNNSKSPISVPLIDQRNIFSFENPKLRYADVQSQSQSLTNCNSSKQMNLLHGIPTNMSLHQSGQHSFGGMNGQVLIPIGQSQSQSQTQSNTNHHQASRQPVLPNRMLIRGGEASSLVDFSTNHKTELTGNSFPLGGSSVISTPALTRGDGVLENKVSRGGVVSSYHLFDDLHQNRSQDWSSRNVGLTFDSNQRTNNVQRGLDMSSSVFFPNNSRDGNVNFLSGEQSGAHRNGSNFGQQHNTFVGDNSWRVKVETFNDGSSHNMPCPEQYAQDDLLTAILKQTENEFGFDGYALDNLPV